MQKSGTGGNPELNIEDNLRCARPITRDRQVQLFFAVTVRTVTAKKSWTCRSLPIIGTNNETVKDVENLIVELQLSMS